MVGNHLPLRILGYRSTMELVLDMPDVVSVCPCGDGTVILKAIPDESTKGIASLVAKQRRSHKVRNSMQKGRTSVCSGRVPYRGRVPPILPAVVKSELKDLLALSPVLLSDFEKAFAKRFGRSFQYMQYGFLSMFEVLNAASDVISVEQTRAGSLLTLKKTASEEKQRGWPAGKIFAQPFRMKQQGSYSTGFPVTKTRFSQPTSSVEPPKPVLNMEKMPTFSAVETSRLNHTEKLNQLIFKEQLSPKQLGFLNVTELVGALSDILRVEFSEEKQDLLVFDADLKPVPPAVKKTTWDCPLKNHKEPEQKIYKKPNLVVKPLQLQVEANKSQLSLSVANHDIPPDAVCAKKLCRLPPLDTSTLVGVFVEYIISPSQFYIRIYSRDSSELLEDMMIEMRRCYSNQLVSDRYIMPEYFIQPGHLCCVRISEDKWWYRVIIHRIIGKKEVEVFYPDFGNIGTVQKSSLRFLKCCYTKLPAQAIPCSLAWVRPAEGFRDLNPLALYTSSSGMAGDTVLTELGPSQQQCFDEDREPRQQSKEDINDEKSSSHLKSGDSKLSSLKTCKSCEDDPQWSILQPKDAKDENEDEIPTGMPCLESVTIGDDIWDENWLPLQAKMGKGGSPASHLFTSSLVGKKQYQSHGDMPQKDWCFSTSKDIWDDSWQPLGLANDMKGGIQTPERPITQEKNTGTTRIRKQEDLQYPLDSSTLPKLEEFYISLIKSQQSAEGSQPEPESIQTQPKHNLLSSVVPSSAPAGLDSPETHSGSVESSPGSLKNEDFSSSHADTVVKDKSQGAIDQLSFILSPQHQISQKLYIPRSTATAVLGAAARLATSRSLLHWYPSVKGWKLEGQEAEKDEMK
ncbi:Tudor domain-containing protein 5 [Cricetulus griseus]|nr:Tudor domain-containing protein 5 [Cricetulus griseus]